MIVTEVIIFILVFFVIKYFWDRKRFFYLASKIPKGSWKLPFLEIYTYITADSKMMLKKLNVFCNNEAELVKSWLGPILYVIATNPDDLKIVFNAKQCYDKPDFLKFSGMLVKGSLFGNLQYWRSHRKVTNPFFGHQGLKAVIPNFNEKTKILIKNLEKKVGKGDFDVFYDLAAFTLETILKVMDFDVDIQNRDTESRDIFINSLEE